MNKYIMILQKKHLTLYFELKLRTEMNKYIMILQKKHLTFYFELKLQVRGIIFRVKIAGTENGKWFLDWDMSATCELLRGRDFNRCYGNVLELAFSREVVGVSPMILSLPSVLCRCPFYCGQVIDRCACSGSSCLNPMLWHVYDPFVERRES